MHPPDHKEFRWGITHATRRKGFTDPKTGIWLKRINRKIRIPIDLYPFRVEEKLTMKAVDGETIMKLETKMIAKDGIVSKFFGKFLGYTPSKGLKEAPEKGPNYEILSYAVTDSDSDLKSTTRSRPNCHRRSSEVPNLRIEAKKQEKRSLEAISRRTNHKTPFRPILAQGDNTVLHDNTVFHDNTVLYDNNDYPCNTNIPL
ncbi:hypothetical protein Tco_1500399 [Tanacetum coccineum]